MSATTIDPNTRRVPPMGGFNLTILRLELLRTLRNRRTMFFALLFPAGLFLAIGSSSGWDDKAGNGNVSAYIMVSMALYAAALTSAATGASVATERALGWSRQLRLTPLNSGVYIVIKALVALFMGAVAIVVVNVVGLIQGRASMPTDRWIYCALLTLACTLVFAALGLFVGYLLPGENVMQILGPGLALLAFLGGVFIPIDEGTVLWHIASVTPMFGVAEVARAPLMDELPWYAVVNVLVWLAIFVGGAAWRMSRDTARV